MSTTAQSSSPAGSTRVVDAFIIGAGFGGMYALHRLRGMGLSVAAIEAGGDVGGTWYWNRYPGARCDVISIDYSYSFSNEIQQAWTWTEQFAQGPEILAYANFVADRLDLRRDIAFGTKATAVIYDDARMLWVITTDSGATVEATYCVMATGPLSVPKGLDIPGAESFKGDIHLSGRWPHHPVDFTNKRVAVIGTGSSGIQIVPVVAETAKHLTVFQRTPSFSLPMRNRPMDPEFTAQIKAHYPALRAIARNTATGGVRPVSTRPMFSVPVAERNALMEEAWDKGGLHFLGLFSDVLLNQAANDIVADFVRAKIDAVVADPATAEHLKPLGYPIFARRPCLDTGYYEAYNRPNVTLSDCLTDPIVRITETGLETQSHAFEFDIIIAATGYDALTGAMLAIDVKGRGGCSLKTAWAAGSSSYLGLAMAGFPNLFMVSGPNGPSALANYILIAEQNVDWLCICIAYMRKHGFATIEASAESEHGWMQHIDELAEKSLMPKANTWYVGANIPGKPHRFAIYTGGLNKYREICDRAADEDYRGFSFEKSLQSEPA